MKFNSYKDHDTIVHAIHAESPMTLKKQPAHFRHCHSRHDPKYATSTLLRLGLLSIAKHSSLLGNRSLLLPLTGSLLVCTLGIHLLLQCTVTGLLSLCSVDL